MSHHEDSNIARDSNNKLLSGYYHLETPICITSKLKLTSPNQGRVDSFLLSVPEPIIGHKPFAGIVELIQRLAQDYEGDIFAFIDQWEGFENVKGPLKSRLLNEFCSRNEETLKEETYFEQKELHCLITNIFGEILKDRKVLIYCDNVHFFPPSTWNYLENWDLTGYANQAEIIFTLNKNQLFSNDYQAANWRRFTKKIDHQYGIVNLPESTIEQFSNANFEVVQVHQPNTKFFLAQAIDSMSLASASDVLVLVNELLDSGASSEIMAEDKLNMYCVVGDAYLFNNEFYSALSYYEQALDIAKVLDSAELISKMYRKMYIVTAHMHELEQTQELASMSIKYAEQTGDEVCILNSYCFLTIWGEYFMHMFKGRAYSHLLAMLKKHGKLNYFSACARKAHLFHSGKDRYVISESIVSEAIEVYKKIRNRHGLAAALHEYSVCQVNLNNTEKAINSLVPSLEIRNSLGDPLEIIKAGNGLGYLYMISGNQERAYSSVMNAFQQLSFVRNWAEVGGTIFNMAMLYFNSKQFKCAAKLFEAVVDIMYILNARAIIFHTRSKVFTLLSICYFKSDEIANGIRTHNKAVQEGSSVLDSLDVEFYRRISKGLLDASQGNLESAFTEFELAKQALNPELEIDKQLQTYYHAEKGIVHLQHGDEETAKLEFNLGMSLSVSLRLWRLAEWFQNALTSFSQPVSKLEEFTYLLHPIIQLAEHEADLRTLQKRNTEFNFRRKIDQLIYTASSIDEIANQFCSLLRINLNVTYVSFRVTSFPGDCIVAAEYNPYPTKLIIGDIRNKINLENSIIIDKKHTLLPAIAPFYFFICIRLESMKNGDVFETIIATDREDAPLNLRDYQLLDTVTKQVLLAFDRIDQEKQLNDQNLLLLQSNEMLEKSHLELEQTHKKTLDLQSQLVQAEKMAGLGTLVAGVAHEINNPLNFVTQGAVILDSELEEFTNLLLTMASDDDEETQAFLTEWLSKMKSHIDVVNNGANRISNIISDLRHFSRLDQADEDNYDLVTGLESTIRLIHSQFNHEIDFELVTDSRPLIRCFPAQINQVLMNLLTNAGDAVYDRYVENPNHNSKIRINVVCDEENVTISIADNGVGISEAHLSKIFDPFFTTKEVGRGTGLGLSVTYSIIEQHNGSIMALSDLGQGTTFTLVLPIGSETRERDKKVSPVQHKSVAKNVEINTSVVVPTSESNTQSDELTDNGGGAKHSVLVVDDDAAMRSFISSLLPNDKFQIFTASSGRDALEFIFNNPLPNIILCDVIMPGLSGYDVCRKLRKMYSPITLPMILITGSNKKDDVLEGFESGANDYMSKPFERKELIARINAQLNTQEINNQLVAANSEIESINASLENKVEKRTAEFKCALSELENQHDKLVRQHDELQKMQSHLVHAEKMTSLGTLLAGIAHELNNPINFIFSGSESLRLKVTKLEDYFFGLVSESSPEDVLSPFRKSFASIQNDLDAIYEGSQRAKGIIVNLHQFSRVEDSQVRVKFSLNEGIESTLNLIKVNFKNTINFELNYEATPYLTGLPAKLNQVYMNVIVNACHALIEKNKEPPSNFEAKIVVSTRIENNYAVVTISDNGNGMPGDVCEKIFEPFYTTKGEGTGLGLAISFNIITEHNGIISVQSEQGVGTTFTIRLPLDTT